MNFRIDPNYLRALSIACAALAVGLLSAISNPASAASSDSDKVRAVVRYDDLNMDSQVGRAELRRRIDDAVEQVCAANRYDRLRTHTYHQCRRAAIKEALTQVGIEDDSVRAARFGDVR